jgi:hypothetical protein
MQAALVSALTGRGAPPAGFDAGRLRAAKSALTAKRLEAVARAWPGVAEALGDCFEEHFHTFTMTTPLPRIGGPLADGRAFLHWLAAANSLPEAGRLQALVVDLRYTTTAGGLRPRRWPSLKAALLHGPRRLVVGLRLPWLGERWLTLPLMRGARFGYTNPKS